jgi:hypothetical protein
LVATPLPPKQALYLVVYEIAIDYGTEISRDGKSERRKFMTKLEGKVAVITGGNSGIGLATAQRFVAEGAYVFITGRRQSELDAAVKQIGKNVTAVQGDVSNLADLDRLYATVKQQKGHLDILFAKRRHRGIWPAGGNHRRAIRQNLQRQRQGPSIHGTKGAPAAKRGKLHRFECVDRFEYGLARVGRL